MTEDNLRIGDILMYFRLEPESESEGIPAVLTRNAIKAALALAGLIAMPDPGRSVSDLAAFKGRGGKLLQPVVKTLGRTGWNEPGRI